MGGGGIVSDEKDQQQVVQSLLDANEIQQGELRRLRESNKLLRKVNSALRNANESYRRQVNLAVENDEMFKKFCNGDFDAPSQNSDESGLLEPGS